LSDYSILGTRPVVSANPASRRIRSAPLPDREGVGAEGAGGRAGPPGGPAGKSHGRRSTWKRAGVFL